MDLPGKLRKIGEPLRRLQWTRGLRAGLAVAAAMIVCHIFSASIGWASGWAALGGFEAILVDNGGPYRSRFATIATLMLAGTVACVAGAMAVGHSPVTAVLVPMIVTATFCFVVTFGRVMAQPVASSSVIILVIYFAALGGSAHTVRQALFNALAFVLGCAWAATLSLFLWPVDPFRPARLAVAECYEILAHFTSSIEPTERGSEARESARSHGFEWQRKMRLRMETARTALGATAARAPSRTIRARNLTVLLETVDILFAGTIRMTELALGIEANGGNAREEELLREFVEWLSSEERSIALALRQKPRKGVVISSSQGLAEAERIRRQASRLAEPDNQRRAVLAHVAGAELDALQNIEIACEAVKAVWMGVEARSGTSRLTTAVNAVSSAKPRAWTESLRANWTLDSVMMRHALRMTVVGAVDILLLRVLHLSHGFWLGMTSIIVLQPYRANTLKRGMQRIGGTIAGGILAAILAALISSHAGIIAVITATSVLTLATYAVDYAWYCFFLTPTFVLLSLPHLRDWQYSGIRMLTTVLGAAVAVGAMRLLWPEREHLALGRLLARAAAAEAAYLRALLRYWKAVASRRTPEERLLVEREHMAPARRACGLASNDAEESLDRLMLEPGFRRMAPPPSTVADSAEVSPPLIREHALTFVTYLRRLTQSVTTLTVLGKESRETIAKLEGMATRLDAIGSALTDGGSPLVVRPLREGDPGPSEGDNDVAEHQMQRMERQVLILERTAAGLQDGLAVSSEAAT